MNAYELADRGFNSERLKHPELWNLCIEMSRMLCQQADRISKYEEALHTIANDYHELSDHKIEVQNRNYKKWARAVLSEKVSDCKKK